jgi:aminoglycoside phosphotransferase family enzyme/predicted kinase
VSRDLIAGLLDPRVYPHPVDRVELIETHISWVFLAGDRVYKVKKPVDLGFLDFTTLARRRFFCQEEVRLNRRLAPDVYLGVIELKGSRRRVRFGGPGRTLEVAVAMRRLPAERMLDRLVRQGTADPALAEAIGITVARFHAAADTGGEIDELGGIDTVRRNWEENFAQTADLSQDVLPAASRQQVRAYVTTFLERQTTTFAGRVRAGRSRDCHGDLQAQHVCCTDPIQIFDCIEFNHRFRFGDTASEIAFLAMDLDRLGRADLATGFLNAYFEESGDYEAVPLLDFYRAYRAWVRGKVLGFQVRERPALLAEARAYFDLALRYTTPRPAPTLIVMTGVMGSGKSTVARTVAARTGAIVVRTDVVRKRLASVPLRERGAQGFGEGLYTPAMGARTYDETLRLADWLLAAGWPVVIDGSFSFAKERRHARELAERRGLACRTLWCDAPEGIIARRLRQRATDRHEVSDGREELLAQHRAQYEPPRGEPDVVVIDTGEEAPADLERVLARLGLPTVERHPLAKRP